MLSPRQRDFVISFVIIVLLALLLIPHAEAVTFVYDDLNRLSQVDYGDGRVIGYTYDAAGNRETRSAPQSSCSYASSPTSHSFLAPGGTGTISVATVSSCQWTASSSQSWLTITSGASGTGNGSIGYSVPLYSGNDDRTATISVGGQTVTITQIGPTGGNDFNNDGKPDILWRNTSTGQNAVWYMNGVTFVNGVMLNSMTDLNWQIVGKGDFNADGKPDILWRNTSTGQNAVWYMNGVTFVNGVLLNSMTDLNWSIVGVGDFNIDGNPDILWRNTSTGQNAVWYMNGVTFIDGVLLNSMTDLAWSIVGVGDFNFDGKPDILWRRTTTSGENAVWYMDGVNLITGAWIDTQNDMTWSTVGVGDFNADGKPDILWRRTTTSGENYVWYMDGVNHTGGGAYINTLTDLTWSIVGR